MSQSLLLVFIGVIVVLFIIVVAIIGTGYMRTRNRNSQSLGEANTAPIPDRDHRNAHTRKDSPEAFNEVGNNLDGIKNKTEESKERL